MTFRRLWRQGRLGFLTRVQAEIIKVYTYPDQTPNTELIREASFTLLIRILFDERSCEA